MPLIPRQKGRTASWVRQGLMAFLLGFIGPGLQGGGTEQWVEVKSPHFIAVSDAGESEARKALRQFEEIREVFRKVFPGIRVDAGRPLSILVLRDEESMKRFLSARFEGKDSVRPSGWFAHSQDEDYAILRLDAGLDLAHPYSLLYHEYTHGIINTNFPHLPVWLNEGLAEFYGATEIQKDKVLIGGIQPARLLHLRQSAFLPADIFFAVDHDSPHYREGQKASQFYAQSWALVHYLLVDPRAQKDGLFRKLLEALGRGVDSIAAARSTFGDLQEFTNSLRTYAKQHAFQYWTFDVATRLSDKDFVSRNLDRAEALTIRAEYLLRSGRPAEARPLLDEALGLDPGLARTYAALGQLDLLGNDPKQARTRLLQAQRLDGRDFRTAYYLGMATLRSGASDDLERAEARLQLERACALNPGFAPAHSMLALACVGHPELRNKALAEAQQAIQLDPASCALRANLGQVFMAFEMEAQARGIGEQLTQAAVSPHEKEVAKTYARSLEEFLETRRRIAAALKAQADFAPTPPRDGAKPAGPSKRLKFSLPEKFKGLGMEVISKLHQGKAEEAIAKVEAALSKATAKGDRKTLQTLLNQLKALPPE